MIDKIAIIVASGSGNRMKSEVPKQFLSIGGVPILVRTVNKFLSIKACNVIVALSKDGFELWKSYCSKHFMDNERVRLVQGGETRFQSVKNAISSIEVEDGIVAIHDGVRPFVSPEIISQSFLLAEKSGSAITCVDSKDSVRVVDKYGKNKSLNRNTVKLIQTPQTFRLPLLKKAFETEFQDSFTDDASVVEASGECIYLMEGTYTNIKITTPEDLALGEIILKEFEQRA